MTAIADPYQWPEPTRATLLAGLTATREADRAAAHLDVPDALPLGRVGRIFLLAYLRSHLLCGDPIDAESWRDAWGRAADYETAFNARAVLR